PATRKRDESLSPLRSRSSVTAQEWSAVAQSQSSPSAEQMPCPYCVILTAIQWSSGRAAMRPATTLVLPTLRECPPMTMIGINSDVSPAEAGSGFIGALPRACALGSLHRRPCGARLAATYGPSPSEHSRALF